MFSTFTLDLSNKSEKNSNNCEQCQRRRVKCNVDPPYSPQSCKMCTLRGEDCRPHMDRKIIVAEQAGVGFGSATPEPEVDSTAAIEPPTCDAPYANVRDIDNQVVGQETVNKDSAVEVNINCSAARSPDLDTGVLLMGASERTLECNEPSSPLDLGAATLFNDAILNVCATIGDEGIRAGPYGTHELFEYVDFSVDESGEK